MSICVPVCMCECVYTCVCIYTKDNRQPQVSQCYSWGTFYLFINDTGSATILERSGQTKLPVLSTPQSGCLHFSTAPAVSITVKLFLFLFLSILQSYLYIYLCDSIPHLPQYKMFLCLYITCWIVLEMEFYSFLPLISLWASHPKPFLQSKLLSPTGLFPCPFYSPTFPVSWF